MEIDNHKPIGKNMNSSGNFIDSSKEVRADENEILLFRGVGKKTSDEQVGNWWSTNPYYAFRYGNAGEGELFVVSIKKQDLETIAKDTTIDEGFNNYYIYTDLPGTRRASEEEINELRSNTVFTKTSMPGGAMMRMPENAVEIGKAIFGKKQVADKE